MSDQVKVCFNNIGTRHHNTEQYFKVSGDQSSKANTVEKVTATSTTSPNKEMEFPTLLDKKKKKRSYSEDSKHQKYFEASRELETTHRISQDLPNCNWLEQKINLSGNKKSFKFSQRLVILIQV